MIRPPNVNNPADMERWTRELTAQVNARANDVSTGVFMTTASGAKVFSGGAGKKAEEGWFWAQIVSATPDVESIDTAVTRYLYSWEELVKGHTGYYWPDDMSTSIDLVGKPAWLVKENGRTGHAVTETEPSTLAHNVAEVPYAYDIPQPAYSPIPEGRVVQMFYTKFVTENGVPYTEYWFDAMPHVYEMTTLPIKTVQYSELSGELTYTTSDDEPHVITTVEECEY